MGDGFIIFHMNYLKEGGWEWILTLNHRKLKKFFTDKARCLPLICPSPHIPAMNVTKTSICFSAVGFNLIVQNKYFQQSLPTMPKVQLEFKMSKKSIKIPHQPQIKVVSTTRKITKFS